MAEAGEAMLAGLHDQARRLLTEPPAMDKRLIELSVAWPGQTGGLARMAAAARLFIITWDPLAGMVERPGGFATTNGGSADLEIVVYLPSGRWCARPPHATARSPASSARGPALPQSRRPVMRTP
jgi:hypothetical protein